MPLSVELHVEVSKIGQNQKHDVASKLTTSAVFVVVLECALPSAEEASWPFPTCSVPYNARAIRACPQS